MTLAIIKKMIGNFIAKFLHISCRSLSSVSFVICGIYYVNTLVFKQCMIQLAL